MQYLHLSFALCILIGNLTIFSMDLASNAPKKSLQQLLGMACKHQVTLSPQQLLRSAQDIDDSPEIARFTAAQEPEHIQMKAYELNSLITMSNSIFNKQYWHTWAPYAAAPAVACCLYTFFKSCYHISSEHIEGLLSGLSYGNWAGHVYEQQSERTGINNALKISKLARQRLAALKKRDTPLNEEELDAILEAVLEELEEPHENVSPKKSLQELLGQACTKQQTFTGEELLAYQQAVAASQELTQYAAAPLERLAMHEEQITTMLHEKESILGQEYWLTWQPHIGKIATCCCLLFLLKSGCRYTRAQLEGLTVGLLAGNWLGQTEERANQRIAINNGKLIASLIELKTAEILSEKIPAIKNAQRAAKEKTE